MHRLLVGSVGAVAAAALLPAPAYAAPHTTVEKTIQDCDGDRLLDWAPGEEHSFRSPSSTQSSPAGGGPSGAGSPRSCGPDAAGGRYRLPNTASILNFLQMTDFQMVDEESPGRVEFLDTTQRFPGFNPFSAAYRPHEAMSTQYAEAMVRQVRGATSPVTGAPLDLTILTGDNADNQQWNEVRWFIDILDGTTARQGKIDPNSGIPVPGCEATPGSIYDGPRGGGRFGYYEPDSSVADADDGDGYSPRRDENERETGRGVVVRDFPHLLEDANEPFEAVGLGMPWYSAFGNHDALLQGNSPDGYFGPGGTSDPLPPHAETFNEPFHEFVTGCTKPTNLPAGSPLREELEDLLAGPGPPSAAELAEFEQHVRDFLADHLANPGGSGLTTEVVPPDARRCFLAKDEPAVAPDLPCMGSSYIQEHFRTTGEPIGHGFMNRPEEARDRNDGYYSFAPVRGLRFVVLDSVSDECGSEFCSEGSVDDDQFEWLRREIAAARTAGEYVLVLSHHTLPTMRQPYAPTADPEEYPLHYGQRVDRQDPSNPQNPASGETLEELYCANNDVVLGHVAGHEHRNFVRRYDCLSGEPPENAPGRFWHVSTAAHMDFPQQSRMIEFVNEGGRLALVLTVVDHTGPAYPGGPLPPRAGQGEAGEQVVRLASIGRELAFNDYQQFPAENARGGREDRNVIVPLERPWPYPSP